MIGIFDSGYGGLTVLKPVIQTLPQYDYLYLGDNARAPYGIQNQENIEKFSEEAVNFLWNRGAELIIFACNTASALALRHIQQKYPDKKVLGVLIPVAEEAVKFKKVGVVGTQATIKSNAYEEQIREISKETKVYSKACPLLVPFIEEDWHHRPEAISILKKYLRSIKSHNVESLILGCTHYPLMQKDFERIMGKKVKILNCGQIVAKKLVDYLKRHPEIEKEIPKNSKRQFLTTGDPKAFKEFIEKHFGMKISMPKQVSLTPTQ
ncbi:glutamate racemase [Patescibacteria group bacterium]|nr:glutamate racemase [Patescibacteria group bacterium]